MDIQKRRFKAVLVLIFCYTFSFGQTWETTIVYDDSLETLNVTVEPQFPIEKYQISFAQNIFKDRAIAAIQTGTIVKEELVYKDVIPPFDIDESIHSFRYTVDLKQSKNVPTKAYSEFKDIYLVNWAEILFNCDQQPDLTIVFWREGQEYVQDIKLLEEWKLNPSTILPVKTLIEVNNISVHTNLPNSKLSDLLANTLENFKYFQDDFDLYLLFGNDSAITGGAFYQNSAVVYIDAQTSDAESPFVIEQVVLHELFHGVSPYDIHPEMEAKWLDKNWLAEATPEYLALKYLLMNRLIDENQFLGAMESKLRIALRYKGLSLNDMSYEIYRNPAYYRAFYTKGAVALFLLELKLFKESKGAINLIDLITGNFPDMDEEERLAISNVLNELEQDLVYNENSFSMNKYFVDFGLIYEKRVVLPFKGDSDTAEVRKENISFNKMASAEQKSRWQGFIAN